MKMDSEHQHLKAKFLASVKRTSRKAKENIKHTQTFQLMKLDLELETPEKPDDENTNKVSKQPA
jgi:hypothetical protein